MPEFLNRTPSLLNERVLVLNASYEPINVCAARRAISLIFRGAALTQEADERVLHSPSALFPLPNVIRLVYYVKIPYRRFTFSKRNIFLRDAMTCQYCKRTFPAKDLTLDHVVPHSRAGEASWENLVTCCRSCNVRKGDRTPEEANMRLMRRPRASRYHSFLHYLHRKGRNKRSWRKYLFYEYSESEWMWVDDESPQH